MNPIGTPPEPPADSRPSSSSNPAVADGANAEWNRALPPPITLISDAERAKLNLEWRKWTRRAWLARLLLGVALAANLWNELSQLRYLSYDQLAQYWTGYMIAWLAPFLVLGLFVPARLVRLLAIGVLAGLFLEQCLTVASQLRFLWFVVTSTGLKTDTLLVLGQEVLQPVGLVGAGLLYNAECHRYGLRPGAVVVSKFLREAWVRMTRRAAAVLRGLAWFDRLTPGLAVAPLVHPVYWRAYYGVRGLEKQVSFDGLVGLLLTCALAGTAVLAARSKPRLRLLACGVSGWYALSVLPGLLKEAGRIDHAKVYHMFGWTDAHGWWLTAWLFLWIALLAVGLAAILRQGWRDVDAATAPFKVPGPALPPEEEPFAVSGDWDAARGTPPANDTPEDTGAP